MYIFLNLMLISFKNYFDKISFDMKISAIFKDQKIIKKFHPFEKIYKNFKLNSL